VGDTLLYRWDGLDWDELDGFHVLRNWPGEPSYDETSAMEYVERRDGAFYVAGSRVSLVSVVLAYRDGAAPETIRADFPTLSLEQIHGALAFYLGHQAEVDASLRDLDAKWAEIDRAATPPGPELQSRIEEARKNLLAHRS
jgi:uncharacterized protein (DUF433 family)